MVVLLRVPFALFLIALSVCQCRGSDGVAVTPETSTYRFICNKLKVGEMYLVPAGWLHFLFYPCEDAELVFGFNKVDYQTVNVVNAFEVPIPQSKYAPGPGVTVEEMDDIIAWVNDAQGSGGA